MSASDIAERLRRYGHHEAADEIERLREVLEFYAYGIGHREIEDGGRTARAAIASPGEGK